MKNNNEKANAVLLKMLNETENANDILAASSPEEAARIKASNQASKENIVRNNIDKDTQAVTQELDVATKYNKKGFVDLTSKLIKESKLEERIKLTDRLDKMGAAHEVNKKEVSPKQPATNSLFEEKKKLIAKFAKMEAAKNENQAKKRAEQEAAQTILLEKRNKTKELEQRRANNIATREKERLAKKEEASKENKKPQNDLLSKLDPSALAAVEGIKNSNLTSQESSSRVPHDVKKKSQSRGG